jgi:hypothetical protein
LKDPGSLVQPRAQSVQRCLLRRCGLPNLGQALLLGGLILRQPLQRLLFP